MQMCSEKGSSIAAFQLTLVPLQAAWQEGGCSHHPGLVGLNRHKASTAAA